MRLSIIAPVLDSHEPVRRQVLHLRKLLPDDCELIVVDDGSTPPLSIDWGRLVVTNDFRPWTNSKAKNAGAAIASGKFFLFLDIDHIIGKSLLAECLAFEGDRLDWARFPAGISETGELEPAPGEARSPAGGVFLIRAEIFRKLNGFDERFCGEYGFEDLDMLRRFDKLADLGKAQPTVTARAPGFYWSGEVPAFHALDHTPSQRNVVLMTENS